MTANLAGARRVIRERSSWHFLTRKPHGANGVGHAKSSFVAHKTAIAVGFAVVPGNYAEVGNAARGEHAFAKYAFCHAKDKSNGIGPGLLGAETGSQLTASSASQCGLPRYFGRTSEIPANGADSSYRPSLRVPDGGRKRVISAVCLRGAF
jgi:hypothetical protein